MYLTYPYKCEINSREDAVRFVQNKCSNCGRYLNCSGAQASKCNDIVAAIVKEYGVMENKDEFV